MKIAVRYYTKTGNTKRLAEAIGKAVDAEALPISTPVTEPVDILFLVIPIMPSALIRKSEALLNPWITIWSERSLISVLRRC